MISWSKGTDYACGYVGRDCRYKYVVSMLRDYSRLRADMKHPETDSWLSLDVPVDSVAEGIQLCEMWEATGAYD